MKFNEKIKELRKKKGLTQEELAIELNVSRQAVTKWETGEGVPDIENLKNIGIFFHVSVDYLIGNKTEQITSLKTKFELIEVFLFLLGICLGFVSKSFEFGFLMCMLLPGIMICIANIVLQIKYEKENNRFALKELQEKNLPTDMFGKILNTNKESKGQRIKYYIVKSILGISVIELFTIVASLFGQDEFTTLGLELSSNIIINNILNYVIAFVIGVCVFFILEYIISEIKIKKYNKSSKSQK